MINLESKYKQAADSYKVHPNEKVWNRINTQLIKKSKTPVFFFKPWAIAASTTAILVLGAILFTWKKSILQESLVLNSKTYSFEIPEKDDDRTLEKIYTLTEAYRKMGKFN